MAQRPLPYIFLLLASVFCFHANIHAQNTDLKIAEKLYSQGDYYSAIPYYQNYLSGKKTGKNISHFTGYLTKISSLKKDSVVRNSKALAINHIADCYRQLNHFDSAAIWYDSASKMNNVKAFPESMYWRAVSLRAIGETARAEDVFIQFVNAHDSDSAFVKAAKKELQNIEFAKKNIAKPSRQKTLVQHLEAPINSNESNYAPYAINQTLYFSSTRPDSSFASTKVNAYQHHVYGSSLIKNQGTNVHKLSFQEDKNIEQGAACFSADGKTVFITQWENNRQKKTGAIYFSHQQDSNWSAPIKMDSSINVSGCNSQQPYLSADGKYLFFASDRPNGFGKFDIWCAELGQNFKPIQVYNLGTTVNTSQNEKAPYFNQTNQTLVYASDGFIGMGGYDLFSSKKASNHFEMPTNLGASINSIKDDIYFYTKEQSPNLFDEAWISSDRASKCCLELFSIHRLPAPVNHIVGVVKNANTLSNIANANMRWKENADKVFSLQSNVDGSYRFVSPDSSDYIVKVTAHGYYDTTAMVAHQFVEAGDSVFAFNFYLQPLPVITLVKDYTIHFDFDKYNLLDSSNAMLDSIISQLQLQGKWKLAVEGYTDAKGSDRYNLALSEKRVKSCVEYLTNHGIEATRLLPKYFGEKLPVAPNTTNDGKDNPIGRQLNRRVKLYLVIVD